MTLAKSMAGFMKGDGFYIISISVRPCKCIVVICFAPGHVQFVVIIRVDRIPLIIRENYCKRCRQNECASVGVLTYQKRLRAAILRVPRLRRNRGFRQIQIIH